MAPHDSFLVFDRKKEIWDYPIHYHPEYEINYISGSSGARRVIGDHLEVIEEKELVLIGSNLPHCWEQYDCVSKDIHEITIQFHEDLFDARFLDRAIMKPIKDMFKRSVHGILFSKEACIALEPRLHRVSKLDGIDYFLEMISILYDLAISRNQRLLSTSTIEPETFEQSEKLKTFLEYIQENYSARIRLSEVAELLNMSTVSFNRFIKRKSGKTFVDYLNDYRIGIASKWLIEKDLSISEIAFNSGFNSIANFNRIFKKSKNCTPSEYRQDFMGIKRVL